MGLVTFGGALLLNAGGLTVDTDCCCDSGCETCPNGESTPAITTLYARITDHTNCGCLDGLCFALTWNTTAPCNTPGHWLGNVTIPGSCITPGLGGYTLFSLSLMCCDGIWRLANNFCLDVDAECCAAGSTPPDMGGTCNPYDLDWTGYGVQGCCDDSLPPDHRINVNISETPC